MDGIVEIELKNKKMPMIVKPIEIVVNKEQTWVKIKNKNNNLISLKDIISTTMIEGDFEDYPHLIVA